MSRSTRSQNTRRMQNTLPGIVVALMLTGTAFAEEGSCEPEGDAWFVSSGPSATLVVFGDGEEPTTALAGGGTVYTCSCDASATRSGTCHPTWNGKNANCTSMTCSDCNLNESSTTSTHFEVADAMVVPVPRVGGFTLADDIALENRLDEIGTWMANENIPMPEIIDDEALAPAGHYLVVEHVGGRGIAYPVPSDWIGDGDGTVALIAGGKAKCKCGGEGKCKWQNITCSPKISKPCDKGCEIHVKNAVPTQFAAPSF